MESVTIRPYSRTRSKLISLTLVLASGLAIWGISTTPEPVESGSSAQINPTAAPSATILPTPTVAAPATAVPIPTATRVPPTPTPAAPGVLPPEEAKKIIEQRAAEVMSALKAKDMQRLATFVHPTTGIRFESTRWIDNGKVWTPEQLPLLVGDPTIYYWGITYAQMDNPPKIQMTFDEYYTKYLYEHDYANAPEVYYNTVSPSASGTGLFDMVPERITIEYHVPGSDKNAGLDWGSLVVEFEQHDQVWYVYGFGHIFWSP